MSILHWLPVAYLVGAGLLCAWIVFRELFMDFENSFTVGLALCLFWPVMLPYALLEIWLDKFYARTGWQWHLHFGREFLRPGWRWAYGRWFGIRFHALGVALDIWNQRRPHAKSTEGAHS